MTRDSVMRAVAITILFAIGAIWSITRSRDAEPPPGAAPAPRVERVPAPGSPDSPDEAPEEGPVAERSTARERSPETDRDSVPPNVLRKVEAVLDYVTTHDEPMPGYVGGTTFQNREGHLPRRDTKGRSIRYREWDVNRKVPGRNRGPERLVTGSGGSAYYTEDHYRTFVRIR